MTACEMKIFLGVILILLTHVFFVRSTSHSQLCFESTLHSRELRMTPKKASSVAIFGFALRQRYSVKLSVLYSSVVGSQAE